MIAVKRKQPDRAAESLRRAHSWLSSNPDVTAGKPAIERQVTLLGDGIVRISQAAATQELHRVAGLERSSSLSVLRVELRQQHMKPIVELARIVAPNAPEFAADVRLPADEVRAGRLLASAEAMAKAVLQLYKASPYRKALGQNGRQYVIEHYNRHQIALDFERADLRGASWLGRLLRVDAGREADGATREE